MGEYHCDCGYSWRGPRYLTADVERLHQLRRHEEVAEAEALLRGVPLPRAIHKEVADPRCRCPEDLYGMEPECPVHGMEAVW